MVRGNSHQGQGGFTQALKPDITPVPEPTAKKVFAGEFSDEEKKEVEKELERFTIVESEHEGQARMKYVPVFVPPAMSKGHYEQFCKKSECFEAV
jgi:trehalose 6-phosphate synthase/phosphatase